MDRPLVWHSDGGHEWLEVPLKELCRVNVADQISQYSYIEQDRGIVFLEGDCDVATYVQAAYAIDGCTPLDENMTAVHHKYDAPCRSLPRYK
jgi:hypothetical protein